MFFGCPFVNTIITASKIAFPHHQERCPRGVIPLSTQQTVPCIVLTPGPVVHRAVKRLGQHSPHTLMSTPLALLHVAIATAAHAAKATSGAKDGQSCCCGKRCGVSNTACYCHCCRNCCCCFCAPKTITSSSSLTSTHSSYPQPTPASVAVGANP
jgi:hypothetical protein